MLVSIAIPCYRSAKTLPGVIDGIRKVFAEHKEYQYEVILVNDGSPDNTFEVIHNLCQEDNQIIGVNLSRNFGQSAAKMAALEYVNGDVLVYMDDDGQHPASGIIPLVEKILEGNDIVYAQFKQKKHSWFKRKTSDLHNWLLYKTGAKPKDIHLTSFLAFSSFSVETLKHSESPVVAVGKYMRMMTTKIGSVEVDHQKRKEGKSGYTLKSLIKLWKNSFTSFNVAALKIATAMGIGCCGIGFIMAVVLIIRKLLNPAMAVGYTSTMVTILVLCGLIMLLIGIVGEYIGKMYMILCNVPPYKVRNVLNKEKGETDAKNKE